MSICSQCNVKSETFFVLRACNHIFCHECLCNYIKLHIDCKIKCPFKNCNINISDQLIRKCLSNTEIEIYEQKSLVKSTKHARKCLTSSCPAIIFIEDDNAIFQCQFCDQPNCLKCKKRHYPNQCGNLDQNEDNIETSAKAAMSQRKRKALEEQLKNNAYIPNPESFDCVICTLFILPREGLIFRNCFHCCCKSCFEENIKTVDFVGNFKCPMCDIELSNQEILTSIGLEKFIGMACKEAAPKMFCCKYPNCDGMWDNSEIRKGTFTCLVCKHTNCLDCEDVHEGLSCETFRQSKKYIDAQNVKEKLKTVKGITCNCGRFLIQKGGCGALHCDSCGKQICVFTKKIAGNNGPDTCGCTPKSPCDPACLYGCFPENKSKKP